MRYPPSALLLLLLLAGCASAPDAPDAVAAEPDAVGAGTVVGETEPLPDAVIAVPQRPFPDDSLYPLLLAEFALRRRDYDLALETYMSQAPILRDPGVSAHTARLAQFMKRDREAIEATRLWVELEPDNLEARLALANLLARNRRNREALPHMVAIVDAGGDANFSQLAAGFESLDEEARAEFLAEVTAQLERHPDNTQLRVLAALLLENLQRTEEAVAVLQPVFDIDPDQLQAIVLDVKLRQDLDQQEGLYDRMLGALERQPDNTRLRLQYARLLTRTDMAEARRQFEKLLSDAPDDADLLFSLALIQRETGDLEGARANLERLLATSPDNRSRANDAHYYLGRIAEEQDRLEDALGHYIQVQPGRDFAAASTRTASLLIATGRLDEVARYFAGLRNDNPQAAEQLYAIEVENLTGGGYHAEALERVNEALSVSPDSIPLLYTRSMLGEKTGDMALMESDLRRILERDPDNSTALNALGYTLANRTDRYAEAEALIGRALELNPGEPAILDSMGWVKFRLGDYEKALIYLRQAYRAFPDPEVAAHLGEVLWVTGDTAAARSVWTKALSQDPEHEVLLETLQRLGVAVDVD
jgi:tetratricopeptide (TPR) repeat protein